MLSGWSNLDGQSSRSLARDVLDRRLAGLDRALLDHRDAFRHLLALQAEGPPGGEGRATTPAELIQALTALFSARAESRVQVLCIDDWQWADRATHDVARAISALATRPILLLAASRDLPDIDSVLGGAQVLELPPFSEAEAQDHICALLPQADPFIRRRIGQLSGGNGLNIEELCHAASSGSLDSSLDHRSSWLEKVIETRFSQLPAEQVELARVASVIGHVVPADLLEELSGIGAGDALVAGLTRNDIICPGDNDGTLLFKHGITRDVIYNSIGLRARREMHLQTAEILRQRESDGDSVGRLESLAHHYCEAGESELTARYAELAGDRARAAFALDRACALYEAALAALDELEASPDNYRRWSAIAPRLAVSYVYDPSAEQLGMLNQALERAHAFGDIAGVSRAQYWLAYIN